MHAWGCIISDYIISPDDTHGSSGTIFMWSRTLSFSIPCWLIPGLHSGYAWCLSSHGLPHIPPHTHSSPSSHTHWSPGFTHFIWPHSGSQQALGFAIHGLKSQYTSSIYQARGSCPQISVKIWPNEGALWCLGLSLPCLPVTAPAN